MPLTDIERQITESVVTNFVIRRKSTPRENLLAEFKRPAMLNHLAGVGVLASRDYNKTFLPTVLAFHYCGDGDKLGLAKTSVEMVIEGLKALLNNNSFDTTRSYTPVNLKIALGMLDVGPIPLQITLGLLLAQEFGVVYINPDPDFVGFDFVGVMPFHIAEHVLDFGNIEFEWNKHVEQRSGNIEGNLRINSMVDAIMVPQGSRKVFVVHGHDDMVKQQVARLLEQLGLEPIILHERPNKGQTVIEKFETNSDVGFAIVLLTPDDEGRAKDDGDLKARARQNVILELGYFIGKLGRARVCALYKEGVELPSDINGVVYVLYDRSGGWRLELARELRAAGINVDLNQN